MYGFGRVVVLLCLLCVVVGCQSSPDEPADDAYFSLAALDTLDRDHPEMLFPEIPGGWMVSQVTVVEEGYEMEVHRRIENGRDSYGLIFFCAGPEATEVTRQCMAESDAVELTEGLYYISTPERPPVEWSFTNDASSVQTAILEFSRATSLERPEGA